MPVQTLLWGAIPPLVIAAALLLAAWRPWRGGTSARGHWGSALAVALSYTIAEPLLNRQWPAFPPSPPVRWLVYLAPAVAVAWISLLNSKRFAAQGWIPYLVTGLCMVALHLRMLTGGGSGPSAALWILLYTIFGAAIWSESIRAARPGTGVRVPLTLCIAAGLTALTMVQSNSLKFAQCAGILAVVMGVMAALALWRPGLDLVRGAAPVYAVLLVGLVACLSSMTLWSALLAMAAAASPWLANIRPLRQRPNWQVTLACCALASALGVAAVGLSPKGFDFAPY